MINKTTVLNNDMFLNKEDTSVFRDIQRLSKREVGIFWLFVNGMTQKEIANACDDLSYHNVTSAMGMIRNKFSVRESHHLICKVVPALIRRECGEFLTGEINERRKETKS